MENSLAIKCPCIQYLLVNTKLVQSALSKPKHLARFFDPTSPNYARLMSTFAKQYVLSPDSDISSKQEIEDVIRDCLQNPENYVLKPQREGGGNNYFGGI